MPTNEPFPTTMLFFFYPHFMFELITVSKNESGSVHGNGSWPDKPGVPFPFVRGPQSQASSLVG